MTEEFIHYLWRFQLIKGPLHSENKESIEVLSTGQRNRDAGPDYLNARIRIGETLWAGDVEIHVKSSDWIAHGHSSDRGYDGVILHVVIENDACIERFDGQEIPALVICDLFEPELFERYEVFLTSLGWIPCEGSIIQVDPSTWDSWFIYLAEERLARKSQFIDRLFAGNNGHLELTLYQCLASGFGQKVNTGPFEWLAQSLDLKLIMKHQEDISALEAMCFGQAGFLDEKPEDDYTARLTETYNFLKTKYDLENMPVHVWKFLRMRPAGFPTVKIAQWAGFLHHNADKLGKLLQLDRAEELLSFFDVETSEYWWDHYHFYRKTKSMPRKLGTDTALSIILNSIIPFIFVRGIRTGDKSILHRAIELLTLLPAEDNTVTRKWKSLGIEADQALTSQALLELKNQYCDHKNCLHCAVGNDLLRSSPRT